MTQKMTQKTLLLPLLLSSLIGTQISAQSPSEREMIERDDEKRTQALKMKPHFQLEKVVVTALKEALAIEDSGATIAHFNTESMARHNATSLGDLFLYEPGVTVDEGRTGNLSDIRIRGMGGDRILILVDGAPLPSTYTFGTYLNTSRNYFDLDAMRSVDIVKGPMSTLYGGSALAGGIFMQTKDPVDFIKEGNRYGGQAKIGYYTAAQEALVSGTAAGFLTDDLSAFIRMTYKKQNERRNYYGKASSTNVTGPSRLNPDPSDSTIKNILSKWVFEPNENHKFSVTLEHFQDSNDDHHLSQKDAISFGIYKQYSSDSKDKNRRQQLTFRHDMENLNTPLFDRGFWQVYYQYNKATQNVFEVRQNIRTQQEMSRVRSSTFNNKSIGFNAEFNKFLDYGTLGHNITYGVSARQNKVVSTRTGDTIDLATDLSIETEPFPNKSFPDSTIREFGIFLQDRISFYDGMFEIIPGLRYDHYRLNPKQGTAYETANEGVLPPTKMSKGKLSKRLAFLYHPNEENVLFLNYSEGFRAPSFSAVNVGFSNPSVGYTSRSNPDLKPETSRQYEIGWNYNDAHNSFALTGFYTKYNNFIEELHMVGIDPNTGWMIFQAINLDKSYIYGLEAKMRTEFLEIQNGRGKFALNLSTAYAKGKEKTSKDPINGVEPLNGTIGLDYSYDDRLYLAARLKLVKAKKVSAISQSSIEQGVTHSPGYGTLDLIGEYKPSRDVTLNAGVYNVLDKKYWAWGDRMMRIGANSIERGTKTGINMGISLTVNF